MGEAGNTIWGRVQAMCESSFHKFCFYREMRYIQGLLHREPSHRDGFTQRDDFTKGCF